MGAWEQGEVQGQEGKDRCARLVHVMAQVVRVRHNGEVVPISALTIDESLCGGEEIYRCARSFRRSLPQTITIAGALLTLFHLNGKCLGWDIWCSGK